MSTEMQTKVQASPAHDFTPAQTGLLQKKSALCNTPGLVEDPGRYKEKLTLQRSLVEQAVTTTVPRFGHDFSRVSVHSTGPGMIQTKLKINEPGDIYEQEADMVAEQVMAMSAHPSIISAPPRIQRFSGQLNGQMDAVPASLGLGLVPVAIRPLSGQTRIQRQGGTYGLLQQWAAKRMYNDFIRNAEIYGLPVRFLRRVGRDYGISFGRSSRVCLTLNMMTLEEADLQSASQIALTYPFGGTSAIRTIYEEATHAYLDMVSNEPRFSRFIAEGVRHYQDARTTGGEITTDPWQVFQEAAGIYVGHRAAIWWSTFESLVINASIACSGPAAAGRLREINKFAQLRDSYNRLMAEVVFGYSYEGGLPWYRVRAGVYHAGHERRDEDFSRSRTVGRQDPRPVRSRGWLPTTASSRGHIKRPCGGAGAYACDCPSCSTPVCRGNVPLTFRGPGKCRECSALFRQSVGSSA